MNSHNGMWYVLRDLLVAPHTFAKPKAVETAIPPAPGAPAPALPPLRPRPAIVAFLRHVGCPFAEVTVRQLASLGAAHPAIDFVAVTHSPEGRSLAWCDAFGGAGAVRIVPDPERAHYAAWGVGCSDRQHFAGKASMVSVRRLLAEGIHNRVAAGSRWQAAATFAVDAESTVRWCHLPNHAGDLPPLDDAVATLSGQPTG